MAPHITWPILVISKKYEFQYHQDTLMLATWMIPKMCTYMVEVSLHWCLRNRLQWPYQSFWNTKPRYRCSFT
jgi:hypothetical protein